MTTGKRSTIDRYGLSEAFLATERQKSTIILEANLLLQQGEYEASSDKFAAAAPLEEALAKELLASGKPGKAFTHQFSALSCWAQAGDLHRALTVGQELLASNSLSVAQRSRVDTYLMLLRRRMVRWISEWQAEPLAAAD